MITREKLRIHEKFRGDMHWFARGSELSERLSITDQDWCLIDEILQSLFIVQSGFASTDFEARARTQTIEAAPDRDVRERLFQLSKPFKTYVIDGEKFSTLEEFGEHFSSRVLEGSYQWHGRSLDAFNDILNGGFGTPEEGFWLVWEHSDLSRIRLGYSETTRCLERALKRCHPSHRDSIAAQLQDARDGKGSTVFDWIVGIIETHGGDEESPVFLELRGKDNTMIQTSAPHRHLNGRVAGE